MKFESYFGCVPNTISKNCILCPNAGDGALFDVFGAKTESKGLFSKVVNYARASVICTKNNLLIGDCVMFLKDSPCENIFLFGSCGGAGNAKIGDIIILKKTFNYESFSEMLEMKRTPDSYYPSHALLNNFLATVNGAELVKQVYGAATSSLVLEKKYMDWFEKNRVMAIDMESSTVFSAANYINRKALCLMYVADHINFLQPDEVLNDEYKKQIIASRKKLSEMLVAYLNA